MQRALLLVVILLTGSASISSASPQGNSRCPSAISKNGELSPAQSMFFSVIDTDANGLLSRAELDQYGRRTACVKNPSRESLAVFSDHVLNGSSTLDACGFAASLTDPHDDDDHIWRDYGELEPQQINLALTESETSATVSWVTARLGTRPRVQVRFRSAGPPTYETAARWLTYDIQGWSGWIYRARLDKLRPWEPYQYRVGSAGTRNSLFEAQYARSHAFSPTMVSSSTASVLSNSTGGGYVWSEWFTVRAPPKPSASIASLGRPLRFLVYGDMGTVMPFGNLVTRTLRRHAASLDYEVDGVVHSGDIAYAGTRGDGSGGWEFIWDLFGRQIQPLASRIPYMTGVGNHEMYPNKNFTAFRSRFNMPGESTGGQNNMWFSFDVGCVHFTSMSTEHDYTLGSVQYNWLDGDMAKARAAGACWLVFLGHRPMYTSTDRKYPQVAAVEPLFRKYAVDIALWGHVHVYESTQGISTDGAIDNRYGHGTRHVVHGTAGALVGKDQWDGLPDWIFHRGHYYGYGLLTATDNELKYEFFDSFEHVKRDEFVIAKR